MYQFFVEPSQIQGNRVVITGNDVNHIKNVLRMQPGEEIAVSNGEDGKEYRCGIESLYEDEIICSLRFVKEDGVELPSKIYLFQGLPKADKMELIVQKAVELGVYEIIPVATKRAVVKLDEKKAKSKIARWQTISEAAAKQSKRRIVPEIHSVMSFKEAIEHSRSCDLKILPYEAENETSLKKVLKDNTEAKKIAVFIGPEGGFDDEEVSIAKQNGFEIVTLGPRIMRTETAPLACISAIMYEIGDW